MWIAIRIVALILALAPIWYLSKEEKISQSRKRTLGVVSAIGIILFVITIFMRFN